MAGPADDDADARTTAGAVLGRYLPIGSWLRAYPRAWLSPDLIAGVTSWAVMVPVALAYAELAGVPASVGLVTATVALTAYAILGTGRHVKVTTTSTMAVMSASIVAPIAAGDPARFVALTAGLAIIVGLLLLAAGLARLGFLSEFLAKPVVTGFLVGLGITIAVGQLPKLLGIDGGDGNVLDQLIAIGEQLPDVDVAALAIGLAAIALILVSRLIDRRIPGPLIAVILAILLVTTLDLQEDGLDVVGVIDTSFPTPSLPDIGVGDIAVLATGAAGMVFLALGESIAAGRAYANRHGYRIDPDQELVAMGGSNVAAGLFGGFSVDASMSSMATGEAAGSRSQVSSLVMAALLLLTILVVAPLFTNLPQTVLAAVIITSVIGVVDLPEWRRYVAWRRTDALLAAVAAVAVLITDVLVGIAVAALFSILLLLLRTSRPSLAVLGRLPGPMPTYVDISRHERAEPIEGLLIVRLDAPLYYFNATAVGDAVLTRVAAAAAPPRFVLLDVATTDDLDVTTADMLHELHAGLEEDGVDLVIVHAKGRVRDRMARVGLIDALGPTGLYPSEESAVVALRAIIDATAAAEAPPPDPAAADDDARPDAGRPEGDG